MWLFTQYGFFSVVCARKGDGSHGQPVDPMRLMIRARIRPHLEGLKNGFEELLNTTEIIETTSTDYRYRMFVEKAEWTQVLKKLSEEMDYDNFKSKVADRIAEVGTEYAHALHDVWSVMYKIQP